MFDRQLGKFFQHASASLGQDKLGVAAILGTAFPLDQSFFGQLIDEDDHAAGENAEPFRQRPLIARGSGSDDAQDSGMAWSNAQIFDSLAKTISPVSAELGEEKGGTGWPLGFAGSHEFPRTLRNYLQESIVHIINGSCK